MSQNTPPGFGDLFGLLGGSNPFTAITKSISQFQRGVSDFLSAVENFNKTMEQMQGVAERVNMLLDTFEEPIKALVPQMTRTIKAADAMVEQLSMPVERVAPGLAKLAEILSSPTLTSFPTDLGEFMETLSDLARRMQPLGQMAESAGSLFGMQSWGRRATAAKSPPPPPIVVEAVAASERPRTTAKKSSPAKKAPAKKAAAKRR